MSNIKLSLNTEVLDNSNQQLSANFIEIANALTCFGVKAGVRILGYKSTELPLFNSLPLANRKQILDCLTVHLDICNQTINAGHSLKDSKQLLWYALKKLGYVPPADLFELIQNDMVVEVHNSELQQVFRNFTYYKYCSYTLEELHCTPWPELYERDMNCHLSIINTVSRLYSGEKRIIKHESDRHIVTEKKSVLGYEMDYQLLYAAGLKGSSKKVEAVLLCEKANILNKIGIDLEERKIKEYLEFSYQGVEGNRI